MTEPRDCASMRTADASGPGDAAQEHDLGSARVSVAVRLWSVLRNLAGDDAYERYVQHHIRAHQSAALLSRRDFYLREQQRKWSGISRCC
jgi:uncharacterized short protein YbdD (DUF466 family)